MDWEQLRRSRNVVDRRGGGVGGGLAVGGGGLIFALLASLLFGGSPLDYLGAGSSSGTQGQVQQTPANDRNADFVSAILGDTEDTWAAIFQKAGRQYNPPRLVLFDGTVNSGCGSASSATGPFYCLLDRQVYMDLSFFRTLETRLGASGDFARAYVIAHEIGHHIQNELGILPRVQEQQQRLSRAQSNALSVRTELMADCLAGVWGHYTAQRGIIDGADVRSAMTAAEAIGDDRLQQQSQGRVVPDSFTHGSSAQRVAWFQRGLQSGNIDDCDAFSVQRP
ncbi:KPN_02809 family neutral zinc metallopeptidase [Deinococcus peraridilitoris]|uniref:Putative metalloprotease n=1 Tax=Deinococcus peraridilitoris (strain DSM 19664 / LMG 22246 / CIP 109416 / KR-200) TaxID=937777 RepID=L0A4G5_DEIPD|nr:neutral zinc metallopeptidase [Deinococcus peraridilitoris]AFZ68736.1 putative metalloprotease [Deinococcus peraridilitoris DSM 19664]